MARSHQPDTRHQPGAFQGPEMAAPAHMACILVVICTANKGDAMGRQRAGVGAHVFSDGQQRPEVAVGAEVQGTPSVGVRLSHISGFSTMEGGISLFFLLE